MLELDIYSYYQLGTSVHPASALLDPQNDGLNWNFIVLMQARSALEQFVTTGFCVMMPRVVDKANTLIQAMEGINPGAHYQNWRQPTDDERRDIAAKVKQFEEVLFEESRRPYVLCVQDQRLLSAYVLVEKVDSAFPEETWKRFSKDVKREIEESGKSLAVERYTGSGFHILRAVECVIREYIEGASKALPTKRDWGSYIDLLKQNGADAKIISVLDNIRTLHRNPLMHPQDWLNQDDAIQLFQIAVSALVALISDMQKRGLAKVY